MSLKYRKIKSEKQYQEYSQALKELLLSGKTDRETEDEIELLTLLIDTYQDETSKLKEVDPIQLVIYLMKENNLTQADLTGILGISKSYLSEILNYKKGLSKDIIRKLATHFKLSQEVFNREYKLRQELVKV